MVPEVVEQVAQHQQVERQILQLLVDSQLMETRVQPVVQILMKAAVEVVLAPQDQFVMAVMEDLSGE